MKLMKTLFTSVVLCGALVASSSFAEEKATEQTAQPVVAQAEAQVAPAVVSDKLNINTATASEIQKSLTGIGTKKAEAIVQYREKHGNFTNAEQLLEVQGIGKATLEKNRDRIIF
ncbi:helix-hairpin-helix domain-containing protein [Haemophilus influenzae]|uniref:helix-hairpin-helix domain-containing protein n=1 Tax=Haemophilus influenzae TaxID=727 RepID=UPI00313D0430